jgi:hypothetical protein
MARLTMAKLLRRLKIAIFGQSWPEMWAQSSARLEAAAIKARHDFTGEWPD